MADELPIFQRVDGKLVPAPYTTRNPKKRYSQVGGAGGSYYVEFTEEEERQRDQEEAKWEAERPQREAEAKKQEEEAARFRASLKYEERIVAFLDVLGWSDAIERSIKDASLIQRLGVTANFLLGHAQFIEQVRKMAGQTTWPGDPQATHFSDCILISVRADRFAYLHLSGMLRFITESLLSLGFVVRGGIAAGSLLHRGAMVYGPALITAYKLEKNHAKVPRVILDRELSEAWRPDLIRDQQGNVLGTTKLWRRDEDDFVFYDYLQPFPMREGAYRGDASFGKRLEPVRSLIIERLREMKNAPKEYEKYLWMARYFNSILQEYPETPLPLIEVA